MTATIPLRVPERVRDEVQVASRITGQTPSELIEAAWNTYKAAPEFELELKSAQKALAEGDIETVTDLIFARAAKGSVQRIRDAQD